MAIGASDYAASVLGDGPGIAEGDKAGSGTGAATLDSESALLRTRSRTATALRFPVGPTETTIQVASTDGFTSDGAVVIGGECVTYTGLTATAFTGCQRGRFIDDGYASPAEHAIGEEVAQEPLPANVRLLSEVSRALQARVELLLVKVSVNAQTGTAYTLTKSDWGRMVVMDNANAITVTVAELLPTGFRCRIAQKGAGKVTVQAAAGGLVTVNAVSGQLSTAARYGVVELLGIGANTYLLTGDTGA